MFEHAGEARGQFRFDGLQALFAVFAGHRQRKRREDARIQIQRTTRQRGAERQAHAGTGAVQSDYRDAAPRSWGERSNEENIQTGIPKESSSNRLSTQMKEGLFAGCRWTCPWPRMELVPSALGTGTAWTGRDPAVSPESVV